jgi:hypothetical protein
MLTAQIHNALPPEWQAVQPIRVGLISNHPTTPDRFVTVSDGAEPHCRIDVYPIELDCYAFEEARVWGTWVVIGFGSYLHMVSLVDGSPLTLPLDAYFCELYPTDAFLLVTSGEQVFRMEPSGIVLWRSATVGLDGVVLHSTTSSILLGQGEWDPPGGWRPFALLAATGDLVRFEKRGAGPELGIHSRFKA